MFASFKSREVTKKAFYCLHLHLKNWFSHLLWEKFIHLDFFYIIGQFLVPNRRAIEEMKKVNYCLSLFQNFSLENIFFLVFFFMYDQSDDQSIIYAQLSVLSVLRFVLGSFYRRPTWCTHSVKTFTGQSWRSLCWGTLDQWRTSHLWVNLQIEDQTVRQT